MGFLGGSRDATVRFVCEFLGDFRLECCLNGIFPRMSEGIIGPMLELTARRS